MKNIPKLIRRFAGILFFSLLLLIILNVCLLSVIALQYTSNASPWQTAKETADAIQATDSGIGLPGQITRRLVSDGIWAVFIDNDTRQIAWQTENIPENIPRSYTLSDISSLTRGYLQDYPTFPGESPYGILILGYPKHSFWKHLWPGWDYQLIADFPKTVLAVLAINAAVIFIIYAAANTKLLASAGPLISGIQALATKEPVHIPEKGLLSEIAANINQTSEILQSQAYQLRRKETARANWIAGVSHDIRTPLSMVMGYAGQLADSPRLSAEERQRAAGIVRHSERMRNLISDLNLASKLEYNMQPLHLSHINIIAVVRQAAVDFINMETADKYPVQWETEEGLPACYAAADKGLLKRAVCNLIWNCIRHNAQGCTIFIRVALVRQVSGRRDTADAAAGCGKATVDAKPAGSNMCCIEVSDNGCGVPDEQIEQLNHAPHYMMCDEQTDRQQHGLGLLIVRQVAASHGGSVVIGHSLHGGFSVKILLPEVDIKAASRKVQVS